MFKAVPVALNSHPACSLGSAIAFLPLTSLLSDVLFFHFVYCLGLLMTITVLETQYKLNKTLHVLSSLLLNLKKVIPLYSSSRLLAEEFIKRLRVSSSL